MRTLPVCSYTLLLAALTAFPASCGDDSPSSPGGSAGSVAGSAGQGGHAGASGSSGNGGHSGNVEAGTDAAPDSDAANEPAACVTPFAGMQIATSTTLCAGTFTLPVANGVAALEVVSDNVTLTCLGTVLDGNGSFGTTKDYTAGIKVQSRSNVTLSGCTFKGYRYGVVGLGASQLVLQGLHLDDNFTDPSADWVQDTVQGGGVRLESVSGGSVLDSTFARNWNGIELRSSQNITVKNNDADHCSNWGALLVAAANNVLQDNDFSWAVRGGLTYPSNWYGVDTKDSAGIVVDDGSHDNKLVHNNATYGGDGIFVRAVIGACAENNLIQDNDTSFSPHNAIEVWCDGNQMIGNTASHSNYGLWTGGADSAVLRGNIVEGSLVDGISIQIGENRHTVIEDNTVTGSGRVGILLTGREFQQWDPLTTWKANPANSSHLVLQRNTMHSNTDYDVFVTSTRSLLLASNCGQGTSEPNVRLGKLPAVTDPNDVTSLAVGACGGAAGRTAPKAALQLPPSISVGTPFTASAAGSTPAVSGDTLSYYWLVQPSAARFVGNSLPSFVLSSVGTESQQVTLPGPGLYDVDLTVHDGHLASMAHQQAAALPVGIKISEALSDWTFVTDCGGIPCNTTITTDPNGADGSSVHVQTSAPYEFAALVPKSKALGLDASTKSTFGLFLRAQNPNANGWQGIWPVVVLASSAGTITYTPQTLLLPVSGPDWIFVAIPLAGGNGWIRQVNGGSLSSIDWLEIHADTWGGEAYDLWFDALTFY